MLLISSPFFVRFRTHNSMQIWLNLVSRIEVLVSVKLTNALLFHSYMLFLDIWSMQPPESNADVFFKFCLGSCKIALKGDTNVKRIVFNSTDQLFAEIRDISFANVGSVLGKRTKELSAIINASQLFWWFIESFLEVMLMQSDCVVSSRMDMHDYIWLGTNTLNWNLVTGTIVFMLELNVNMVPACKFIECFWAEVTFLWVYLIDDMQ